MSGASSARAAEQLPATLLPPEVPPELESPGPGPHSSSRCPGKRHHCPFPGPESGLHHTRRSRSPVLTGTFRNKPRSGGGEQPVVASCSRQFCCVVSEGGALFVWFQFCF